MLTFGDILAVGARAQHESHQDKALEVANRAALRGIVGRVEAAAGRLELVAHGRLAIVKHVPQEVGHAACRAAVQTVQVEGPQEPVQDPPQKHHRHRDGALAGLAGGRVQRHGDTVNEGVVAWLQPPSVDAQLRMQLLRRGASESHQAALVCCDNLTQGEGRLCKAVRRA